MKRRVSSVSRAGAARPPIRSTETTDPPARAADTGTLRSGLDLQNEWMSVRYTGSAPVQLAGCTISDASVLVYTFPSFVFAAGATVTVRTGTARTRPSTSIGASARPSGDPGDTAG